MIKLLLSFSIISLLSGFGWGQANYFELTDSVITEGAVYHIPDLRYSACTGYDNTAEPANIEYVDSLADFLKSHKELIVEIRTHTDSRGSSDANKKLSQQRANNLKYLLVLRGVDESKIQSVGLGEDEPRTVRVVDGKHFFYPDPNWNTHEKIILTEKYINKFRSTDKKLYNQLHQWNRRTEIVVIGIVD